MEFPVAIHKEEGTVYGVSVPDLKGCHSWGADLAQAGKNAKTAIELHIRTLIATGHKPEISISTVEALRKDEIYANAVWAFVDVDVAALQH
jgi:predicted RNase H-like HicB family nuclease